MKLFEYQSKEIFLKYGVPSPKGIVIDDAGSIESIINDIKLPCAVKAQVLVGGRGKAGGIKIAKTQNEVKSFVKELLAMKIKNIPVKKVLIEEAIDIEKEYYLGITVDRAQRSNVLIFSRVGGVDIEQTAIKEPDKIVKFEIETPHPAPIGSGHPSPQSREGLDLPRLWRGVRVPEIPNNIIESLIEAYFDLDASLIEINPLVKTKDACLPDRQAKFLAADAKIIIDDNALFRHPEFKNLSQESEDDKIEAEAHRRKISYVRLQGTIAVICNGAGLTMTTMDEVKREGGDPACFLDIGGGSKADFVASALEVINMDSNVKGIFFNIFGGISRCDEVVKGIIEGRKKVKINVPIVIRLTGNREKEGRELLKQTDLICADSMRDGAKKIVGLVNK